MDNKTENYKDNGEELQCSFYWISREADLVYCLVVAIPIFLSVCPFVRITLRTKCSSVGGANEPQLFPALYWSDKILSNQGSNYSQMCSTKSSDLPDKEIFVRSSLYWQNQHLCTDPIKLLSHPSLACTLAL